MQFNVNQTESRNCMGTTDRESEHGPRSEAPTPEYSTAEQA